jgi:osmoprotectant transport system substrate-binding protein
LRTRSLALAATIVTLSLVLAACGSSDDSGDGGGSDDGGDKEALIVGSKDFAGAQVISQAYGQALEAEGYQITYKDNIGPTETVFPLLEKGDIDLYGEFSGTFLTYLGGTPTSDRTEVFTAVEDELADKDIVAVGPATAQDVNAFYVLEDTAEEYDLETISDLKEAAPELVFGGPPECLDRPLCLGTTEQQLYGLQFEEVKKLDAGGSITNSALDDGTIDVGLLFTGSSLIKDDYVQLEDDQGLQPADNPIALVRKAKATPEVRAILKTINTKLDVEAYNELSLKVLNDKEDPADVVADWLQDEGIVE